MAENHIRTNSMGLQCVVQCCYEHHALSQTRLSPSFPVQTLYKHPILHSGPQKQRSQKFPQNSGSTPTPCLDKAVHAQMGGGGGLARNKVLAQAGVGK